MKTALVAIAALLLVAPLANAHQSMLAVVQAPAVHPVTHEDRTYYVLMGRVYEETNGQLAGGVNSHAGTVTGDTGVQQHQVCYGTFTPQDVVAWNWVSSGGHFGFPPGSEQQLAGDFSENDINYIPFTAESGFYTLGAYELADCLESTGRFVQPDARIA